MKNLVIQNNPSPNATRFPRIVPVNSADEVRQSIPINSITNAIKNECTYINWRFIILKAPNSFFHSKYRGKEAWINASKISRLPVILRCCSTLNEIYYLIFLAAIENGHKGCEFCFLNNRKAGFFKWWLPHRCREEMCKSDRKSQEVWKIPQVLNHDYFAAWPAKAMTFF